MTPAAMVLTSRITLYHIFLFFLYRDSSWVDNAKLYCTLYCAVHQILLYVISFCMIRSRRILRQGSITLAVFLSVRAPTTSKCRTKYGTTMCRFVPQRKLNERWDQHPGCCSVIRCCTSTCTIQSCSAVQYRPRMSDDEPRLAASASLSSPCLFLCRAPSLPCMPHYRSPWRRRTSPNPWGISGRWRSSWISCDTVRMASVEPRCDRGVPDLGFPSLSCPVPGFGCWAFKPLQYSTVHGTRQRWYMREVPSLCLVGRVHPE